MPNWKQITEGLQKVIERYFGNLQDQMREIVEVDSWDGAASNYETTNDYCKACLIDVNPEGEDKVQGLCKLPVRRQGDSASVYVDKAVMAAAGGHGITQLTKPTDVPQDEWDAAVKEAARKIISAYDQMDATAPEAVYTLAEMEYPERAISMGFAWEKIYNELGLYLAANGKDPYDFWINDLYFDDNGQPFVVFSGEGKLYRAEMVISDNELTLSNMREVIVNFTERTNRFEIKRQADGNYRWFGISCTSVLNRIGVFDTRELFDNLVKNFEDHPEIEVIRQFYHQGSQFRTGVVDFVARDGNVLITSGIYDDSELAKMEIKARQKDPSYWGDSIGYLGESPLMVDIGDGIEIPAYRNGYLREVSTLPEDSAASLFTTQTVQEVNRMLSQRTMEAFVKLFEGDEVKAKAWLENNVDETNRAIAEDNLLTRSTEDETPKETNQNPNIELNAEAEIVLGDEDFAELARMVGDAVIHSDQIVKLVAGLASAFEDLQNVSELMETANRTIKSIDERVAALEVDEEEKRQQWASDLPSNQRLRISHRPSQPENISDDADEPGEQRGKAALDKLPVMSFAK